MCFVIWSQGDLLDVVKRLLAGDDFGARCTGATLLPRLRAALSMPDASVGVGALHLKNGQRGV